MDASILDSRYSWIRLGLTLAISVLGSAGMWILVGVLPEIQADFDVGRGAASVPYVTTMVGFALGNMMIGHAVDRYGVVLSLIASAVLMAAGYAASTVAPTLWVLCVTQFAIGFGTSACFGPLMADVSQWFLRRRGIAVAVAASGNYLSGALWPLLLGSLFEGDGWRIIYVVLTVVTVVVMIPLCLTLRRPLPAAARAAAEVQASARARETGLSPRALSWLLACAGIACCVAMAMPQVHIVALCVDMGFGATVGAEMLTLMLLGGVVSRVISGLVADRLGGVRTLLIGSTLQTIALCLYLPADGLTSLYVVSLVFGLSQGGIVPSYAVIVREYLPAKEAGARVGFVIMMTVLGMALGGWMSGVIYDATGSYSWAFLNGIAWNALNIAIMVFVLMRGRGAMRGMMAGA